MPTLTPSNPRGLLETAANNVSSFSARRPETFPAELPSSEVPVWALDPREEELEHESTTTDGIYEQVGTTHIVYIGVEFGNDASARSSARSSLDSLRDEYLVEMHKAFSSVGKGYVTKTGRNRTSIRQGESSLLVDAISIEVVQVQDYTS